MQVTEINGPRFELALERLLGGHAFSLQGINFCLAPDGGLEVSVDSSWRVENVTEQRALKDLRRAESLFASLSTSSSAFADIARRHPRRFILIYEYGSGSIELARLVNETLVWAQGMVPAAG